MIARLVIGLALLAIVAGAVWVYRDEWIRDELDSGLGPIAARDSYHAARQFLLRHGIRSHREGELLVGPRFPSTDAALLFTSPRLALREVDETRLLDWVRAGGTLITTASRPGEVGLYGRRDRLDDALGVSTTEHVIEAVADDGEPRVKVDRDGCVVDPYRRLEGSTQLRGHAVAAHSTRRLTTTAQANRGALVQAADAGGALLHRVRVGRGSVTYVAEPLMWDNWSIGCLDHAHVLLGLVSPSRELLIIDSGRRATLADLLWRRGKALLGALAVLLALWLWHVVPRFGPLQPAPSLARRERLDALRAHGHFLWRRRAVEPLLDGLRRLTRATARRRFGRDDAIEALARRAGVSPDAARTAVTATPRQEVDVIKSTNTLLELIDSR